MQNTFKNEICTKSHHLKQQYFQKISNKAPLPKPTLHAERYWSLAENEPLFRQTYIRACI